MYTLKKKKDLKSTNFQLKKPEKEQTKLRANRKKEIKIIAEINQIENRKKSMKLSWFVEKFNKIEKILARLPNKTGRRLK